MHYARELSCCIFGDEMKGDLIDYNLAYSGYTKIFVYSFIGEWYYSFTEPVTRLL